MFIDAEGEKMPDKTVKNMLSSLALDPLGLMRKVGQDRFEFILKCSDLDIKKFNDLKVERTQKADDRKQAKKHSEYLLNIRGEQPERVERVDVSIKQGELEGAYSHNNQIDRAKQKKEGFEEAIRTEEDHIKRSKEKIAALQADIKNSEAKIVESKKSIETAEEWLKDNILIDLTELQDEIEKAGAINKQADFHEQWLKKHNEYSEENTKWCLLDEEVRELDEEIQNLTKEIRFPLDGVTVEGSEIFYNAINYDALGTSEQILLSSTLVAKHIVSLNKGNKEVINVMTIDRGESMDLETQKRVMEECNKIGVQVFISIVDRKSDTDTFEIEYSEFSE